MAKIIINPVTRISGFAEIEVLIENKKIIDAKTKGFLFRGFEKILLGRNPFDAVYVTERICGICSTAHAVASTLALEDMLKIEPTEQGKYLRDITHGCEFLQNHIRHFYQYTIPDFVKLPNISSIYNIEHNDFRLPKNINDEIANNYFDSLNISRKAHEMLAIFGGKVPHNHGIFIGGITTQPTVDKIIKIKSILKEISDFIDYKMIPDVYTIAKYYKDCFQLGKGYGNFLSYGCFDNYKELGNLYVNPVTYNNGVILDFQPDNITENIDNSWYEGQKGTYAPLEELPNPDMDKSKAYSWVKAARYNNLPYEVGPLARQWLSGEYRKGISLMDRTIARVLEAKKITQVMKTLLENIVPNISVQKKYDLPDKAEGVGLIDTTRGALGHWTKIENKVISFYQLIPPTVWNFSTVDQNGYKGITEQALIGTHIQNTDKPVEIGRIIRSFDPCISCATHVHYPGKETKIFTVV